MESNALPSPPDRPEAAVPSPSGDQDAVERAHARQDDLEERAKAVPGALRIDEEAPSPATLMTEFTALSGPLPPPEMLAQYEEILPGAAERILSMAERQAEHRQKMERDESEAERALKRDESEADRTLKREESEADRALDGEELRLTHRREMSGVVVGAGVVFSVLVTAVILAFLGATTPAAWLGGSSLAALAGVFVYGVRQRDAHGEDDARPEGND